MTMARGDVFPFAAGKEQRTDLTEFSAVWAYNPLFKTQPPGPANRYGCGLGKL